MSHDYSKTPPTLKSIEITVTLWKKPKDRLDDILPFNTVISSGQLLSEHLADVVLRKNWWMARFTDVVARFKPCTLKGGPAGNYVISYSTDCLAVRVFTLISHIETGNGRRLLGKIIQNNMDRFILFQSTWEEELLLIITQGQTYWGHSWDWQNWGTPIQKKISES